MCSLEWTYVTVYQYGSILEEILLIQYINYGLQAFPFSHTPEFVLVECVCGAARSRGAMWVGLGEPPRLINSYQVQLALAVLPTLASLPSDLAFQATHSQRSGKIPRASFDHLNP